MNEVENFDFSIQNKLLTINNKLSTYKNLISCQKNEILKTEEYLKKFKEHLKIQKDALKLFEEEEHFLEECKTKIIENNKNICENIPKSSTEQNINEINISEKTKEINCHETIEKISPEINHNLKTSKRQSNISTINIKEINNTVYSMFVYKDDIFIGGSNGMLMRYSSSKKIFIYETKVKERIMQIEVIKCKQVVSLLAFSKTTVMIYKDMASLVLSKEINLRGIGYVFNQGGTIFIPLKSGVIMKMINGTFETSILATLPYGDVCSFITGHSKNHFSLINFNNSLLYKCLQSVNSLIDIDRIEGVKDIKRVIKIPSIGSLYYSDKKMWIVDLNLKNEEIIKFENGIKLVEVHGVTVAVVDHDETLRVYKFI